MLTFTVVFPPEMSTDERKKFAATPVTPAGGDTTTLTLEPPDTLPTENAPLVTVT
jgi:hypothetical protein